MMQVLVCDDSLQIAESLAKKIESACNGSSTTAVTQDQFQDIMKTVYDRRAALRSDGNDDIVIESTDVDDADIVVVDYDLLRYSETGDTTGSRLAYLLRCFTRCGLIVVLNEYGTNSFDMSLRSPSQDFADLHLGATQIGNPGLWTNSFEGYRPWHWPVLPHARENFEKCVKDVHENLDQPILDFFGFERFIDWLPKQAYEFFLGKDPIDSVRFDSLVKQTRGGIEPKDELLSEYAERVAAARLIALLNGLILPEQSLLVDAPHLVSRFPSLIRENSQDIRHWNRLCDPLCDEIDDLLNDTLKRQRFKNRHWLWKPAWYWPDILRDEDITEVIDPWTVEEVDWVFCENVSRFIPEEFADGFRADVMPPFNKRFVLKRESTETHEFVSMVGSGEPQDPLDVDYVPQAVFSV